MAIKTEETVSDSYRFDGGIYSTVPHCMVLSCPYRNAFSLFCTEGGGILKESRNIWRLPPEAVILIKSGQTPLLQADGSEPLPVSQMIIEGREPWKADSAPAVLSLPPEQHLVRHFAAVQERLPCADENELLQEFLKEFQTAAQPVQPSGTLPPASIQSLKLILDTRFAEKLTLDSLSKELHWNKYKLDKDFKLYYGSSPFEYLLNVRVQEACRLLRTTSRSVLDIGFAVGVENTSYFIRLFKKRTGTSPLAYRNRFFRPADRTAHTSTTLE